MTDKPHGWKARVTSERTTFTFRVNSWLRWMFTAVFIATPFTYLAQSMTRAAIAERNWGVENIVAALFDFVALGALALLVLSIGYTRITIGEGHVVWRDGPILRRNERLTFEEAMTFAAFSRSIGRGAFMVDVTFRRNGNVVKITSAIDYASARFVVQQIQDEITRRDPEILSRIPTDGFPRLS